MLKVYDTLTESLKVFVPLVEGQIKMYVCGPTVYDHAHIGHARAYVCYDVMVRFLRHMGYQVTYARNLTDVDDKIILKANKDNVSFDHIAKLYTQSFHQDMKTLGLLSPDHEPKATESINEMVAMIQTLIQKGHAYESLGDVYFKIRSYENYGALSKRSRDDLMVGARVEVSEKKSDPLDFALWKKAKPGEPFWSSPWSDGRPGWHIECSAMSLQELGQTIDIHAGGRDLIFPHHENEIAQSQCANDAIFARYWLHNGFVTLKQEKMSKSLGNTLILKSLFQSHHPESIKLYLMYTHYRHPLEFSFEGLQEAARSLDRMYRVLKYCPPIKHLVDTSSMKLFVEAMSEDFNTAKAIALLHDLVSKANKEALKSNQESANLYASTLHHIANLMGLLQDDPKTYFHCLPSNLSLDVSWIEDQMLRRHQARQNKDYSLADQIRIEMESKGIAVEDGPLGSTWFVSKK